ncbi:MAG: hypothetical protein JW910_14610 [Anaerolineae bacterium]|nr:hypothetical protein [Anaerolineae bacterium]
MTLAKTTKSNYLRIAFVLDERSLRQISAILADVSARINYGVKCLDNSEFETESIEDILNLPNTIERQILSISLRTDWTTDPNIQITLRQDRSSFASLGAVEYRISGNEKDVYFHSDRVESNLLNLRQWYTPFAVRDYVMILLSFLGAISLGLVVSSVLITIGLSLASGIPMQSSSSSSISSSFGWAMGITISALTIALGTALNSIRRRVFPVGEFLIGDGVRRHKRVQFARSLILSIFGVLFSIALSILANILTPIFQG